MHTLAQTLHLVFEITGIEFQQIFCAANPCIKLIRI